MSSLVQALAGVPNACQILPTVLTGGQPSAAHLKALHGAGGMIVLDLRRILAVLRGAGDRVVLVHCGSGNRVGGALIPFLMLDHGLEEEDAVGQAMRIGLRSAELMEWGLDYARRNRSP
jgi:hypothetical protein